LAADSRISAANDGIELARQQYKPGWAIDLGYAYRDGRLPTGMSRSDFATVSFTMDLPYFRKNRQDREVAAARSVRRAAHASKEQFLRQLASQLEVEYARWHELSRRIDLYQRQVLEQAHERTRAARVAYQSGTGDFADVMRGSIDELNTRLDFIRLQVDRAQSHAVVANLGGLTL
ncbi:MAG: TolC family protein, partial [Gammaproteobacteria bacterium]|nr:TolC family protein [Gammaproteobacteria bacterium]